ncbi:hypothetical protein C9374_001482 [Naegleria lovaniensis]|uniref:Guanine nucleotide-binding protein subunit beta-like protein n=1 Tax=Naegleria lovaniensis TaxID=51637 RepID=A0AA88GUI5_NAELO|nr:uncharacterized protein C9374_001482 [Naegleria lovaniensis]KAG2387150.1 hypothetical protein C9374_001482 [Naegleria lovaniensis]
MSDNEDPQSPLLVHQQSNNNIINDTSFEPGSPQLNVDKKEEENAALEIFEGTRLKFFHTLGFRNIPQAIQHLENEEEIVYLVGKHVSIFNYEKRTHTFILKSGNVLEIHAFAISYNRKFIALSESINSADSKRKSQQNLNQTKESTTEYQISVYNFRTAKRARVLNVVGTSGKPSPVISMAFSRDAKYLTAVTDEPDQSIYLWHLEKSNKVSSKKIPFRVTQITINPYSHWQMATTGPDDMKIWRFTEGELKHIDPIGSDKYTYRCHTWFDDEKLLVGTEEGQILVIDGKNVVKTFSNVHPNASGILCIEAIDRGFVCAGENGYFSVFERTYDSEYFNHYKRFRTLEKRKIVSICVSRKENNVICCYDDNKFAYFSLTNVDILKENDNNFTLLPIGFHGQLVQGLATCVQKPLMVTCGSDRTLRIWNYMKRQVELEKTFDEDIYCVTMDPTGTRILIGFRYKLSCFAILSKDLYLLHDWHVKSCKIATFCNGGQYFACVSATSILIISSLTFQVVNTLRGHSGIIKSIVWGKDDIHLASASFDGSICQWDLVSDKLRIFENVVKTCNFRCVAYDHKTNTCSAVGNDGNVWTFRNGSLYSQIPTREDLTSIIYSSHSEVAVIGTTSGKLLLYSWPPEKPVNNSDKALLEYEVHNGSVVSLMLTSDERFLFSLGSDDTLFMLELDTWKEGKPLQFKHFEFDKFYDLYYTLKASEEEIEQQIVDLTERSKQAHDDHERKFEQLTEQYTQEMEKQRIQYTNEIKELKRVNNQLVQQLTDQDISFKENLNKVEYTHQEEIDKERITAESNVAECKAKYEKEVEGLKEKLAYFVDLVKVMTEKHEEEIEKLKQEYEEEKLQLVETYDNLSQDFKQLSSVYQSTVQQGEEDFDTQLKRVKTSLIHTIEKHKQSVIEAKGEAVKKGTKVEELKKEIVALKNKIAKQEEKIHQLEKKHDEYRTTIDTLQVDKKKQEDAILMQERDKKDLFRQAKELEQMRYVLTFKFNKLKNEVSPKENLISELREDLKNIEKELLQAKIENDNLQSQIAQKNEKIEVIQSESVKLKQTVDDKTRVLVLLIQELSNLTSNGDSKLTNVHLKKIVSRYNTILTKGIKANNQGEKLRDTIEEFERQRGFLEQTISGMKRTLSTREDHLKGDLVRKNNENSVLVEEINQLRKDQKQYKQRIISLEYQLKNALHFQQQQQLQQQGKEFNTSTAASTISSARSRRAGSATSVRSSLNRIRTPDTYFVPINNGTTIPGSGSSSDNTITGLDRKKVAEFVDSLEKNNKRFEQQQQEIDKLKNYVQNLLETEENINMQDMIETIQTPSVTPTMVIESRSSSSTTNAASSTPATTTKLAPIKLNKNA